MSKDIIGTWKVNQMERWFWGLKQDILIEFGKDGRGCFKAGDLFAFSWQYIESEDRVNFQFANNGLGQGWVVTDGREMDGFIVFQFGLDSQFRAKAACAQ